MSNTTNPNPVSGFFLDEDSKLFLTAMKACNSVEMELNRQMKEEIGEDLLDEKQTRMLQQKYGIQNPVHTGVEANIISQGKKNGKR